jgi:hypothetical protein
MLVRDEMWFWIGSINSPPTFVFCTGNATFRSETRLETVFALSRTETSQTVHPKRLSLPSAGWTLYPILPFVRISNTKYRADIMGDNGETTTGGGPGGAPMNDE